jgi:hypothetical protein
MGKPNADPHAQYLSNLCWDKRRTVSKLTRELIVLVRDRKIDQAIGLADKLEPMLSPYRREDQGKTA